MKNLPIILTLFLSIIFAQPGSDVPENMSFQGFLTDSEGVAYADGEYDLIFRLIREMNDGSEETIWEESHTTSVTNGVFSLVLGDQIPLPLNISPNVQLETQVGEEILSPRQVLTSVPFALKSSRSQQAYQSVYADSAQYALYAQHSHLSDTAMVSLNAPMADTAQFAINANQSELSIQSTYSDTAQFAQLAESAEQAIEADTAVVSHHSVYADTASLAMGIIGGINIEHVEHSTYSDTANLALGIVGGIQLDNVQFATYADTAQFVQQAQSALTANEATFSIHSTHADTAQFVQQAQNALTSNISQNSTNAIYADTASYLNVSDITENIIVTKNDDAKITLFSTGDGSSSYVTLVAQKPDGQQTELRVINEGGTNELIIRDATNDNTLMSIGVNGNITATSFIGDGSSLTGISTIGSLSDLGLSATAEELNYVDGVTAPVQTQLDAKATNLNELSDAVTDNINNIGIGNQALNNNQTGEGNTAIGSGALQNNITSSYNVAVGKEALSLNTNGTYNTALGTSSLKNNTTGNYVTGLGANALIANTTGTGNTAVGTNALESNTTGASNTVSGWNSMPSNTTGSSNVAMGVHSMSANTTGGFNTAIGSSSLGLNTTGGGNTATGNDALYNNTTGGFNIALGSNALKSNTEGGNNVAIGYSAGRKNISGTGNVFIGNEAGNNNNYETSSNNLVIANSDTDTPLIDGDFSASTLNINGALTASSVAAGGVSSTEFGYLDGLTSAVQTQLDAKQASDDDLADLADGTLSASKVENAITTAGTSGQVWTSDGDGAGTWSTSSSGASSVNGLSDALVEGYSLYIGENPSATTNGASYNVSVGITALENITSGDQNVAIGYNALEENITGERNVGVGYQALENTSTGSKNTAVGRTSLPFNTSGDGNTALGDFTMYYNTTGDGNIAIGQGAGQRNTTGSDNVFLGKNAGSNENHVSSSDQLVIANSNTTTPLIDGDFSASTLKVNGSLAVTGSMTMSVASTITSSSTYNGSETIIPVNGEGIIVTIDSDQVIAGRILIIKNLVENNGFYLETEGNAQIQVASQALASSVTLSSYYAVTLFCDGTNWYDLNKSD